MNISPAHWHLLLNHFPIVLSMIGMLFLGAALIFRKEHLKYGGTLLLIGAAITGFASYKTGPGAAHALKGFDGVSHEMIETHAHYASTGNTVVICLGILALITLLLIHLRKKSAQAFLIITFIASLGTAVLFSYIGYTGGEIRHSEIRGDFGTPGNMKPDKTENKTDKKAEDDADEDDAAY